ncbi:MAG: PdxA family dehydrogenase [Candidatus Muiribacteriota bacterium]
MKKYKTAITTGDLNGIGIEILSKAFLKEPSLFDNVLIIGNKKSLLKYCQLSKIGDNFLNNLDFFNIEPSFTPDFGKISAQSGRLSYESVIKSIKLLKNKRVSSVVTLPICKESWYCAGIKYPGHTEIFGEMCENNNFNMLMKGNYFSVGLVTVHESIKKVPELITEKKIIESINNCLIFGKKIYGKNFRMAICSLNPHAGEGGYIGDEEKKIVNALEFFEKEKTLSRTIYAADTLFYKMYQKNEFNLALCMYHDQALIPFKMVNFDSGVNITWGGDFIRTSPDHGVAFDIAGQNKANPSSFIQALKLALKLAGES